MAYTNSPLVAYTKLSTNHSGQRTHSIDRITPHCVVGQLSAESICGCFISASRQASCNYGIGYDGKVALCVEEKNRSWCSSSKANDQRAITIECASDRKEPYAFNDKVYQSLIRLCADICKRNGKTKLLWLGDKQRTLSYQPKPGEMVLTVHRWFANKSCPGNWLYARMGDLAKNVTAMLGNGSTAPSGVPNTKQEATSGTMSPVSTTVPFQAKVSIPNLCIRKGPGDELRQDREVHRSRGIHHHRGQGRFRLCKGLGQAEIRRRLGEPRSLRKKLMGRLLCPLRSKIHGGHYFFCAKLGVWGFPNT